MAFAAPPARRRLRSSPTHALARIAAAAALSVVTAAAAAAQPPVAASPRPAASAPDGEAILADIRALTAPGMDGRAAATPGNAKARQWIVEQFAALGLPAVEGASAYGHVFTFRSKAGPLLPGVNLLASCTGRQPELPVMVVSAHYDHLGIRDGQTYHGADDNASGVAMLLALARRCVAAPFRRTMVLAAFDAEEQGLQGAKAFLASPPIPVERIAVNLNFDMVSRSDRRELYVAGPGRWPALKPIIEGPASRASITVKFGHDTGGGQDDWTMQSDHGPFHAAGIPFVYLGVEDHADYHKPGDTADKIAPGFLAGVAAFVVDIVGALDRAASFK